MTNITKDNEIFLLGITMNKDEYKKFIEPKAECDINVYTNDNLFNNMSQENKDKVANLQNQFLDIVRETMIESFIDGLRDKGFSESEIKQVYQ